jgi:hypothetical protein
MRSSKALSVAAVTTLACLGALLSASLPAGGGAPQQNEEAIAKALAEKLHDKLGYQGETSAAPPEEKAVLYPIKVRGGAVPVTVSTIRRFNGGVVIYAHFKFKRGPKAAGPDGKGLGPGECAWVDRRLNPDEPCELLLYGFDAKVHFKPGETAGAGGYVISMEARSNAAGKSRPWHKDYFLSFSDPSEVDEFWVTKSKDSKYLVCRLD